MYRSVSYTHLDVYKRQEIYRKQGRTMKKEEFIQKIAGYVKKYAAAYEIKVCSPIIAQAILESGWGESRLAKDYHNYFGLKCGTKWQGKSVNLATWEEYEAGTAMVISDYFRIFDNMEEGVKGYFEPVSYTHLDVYKRQGEKIVFDESQ